MTGIFKKADLPASAICIENDKIFAAFQDIASGTVNLVSLDPVSNETSTIASFEGSKCFLLYALNGKMFIGIDNHLLLRDHDDHWKVVLRSMYSSNFFWHMAISGDEAFYVQEYGRPPTGIYRSVDGHKWKLIVTSTKLDRHARHFHSIAYDQFRSTLIATLGDRNPTRIVISSDEGENWKSLYKGAWQVLPIEVMKDQIVFGMDEAISRGGLMIYFPNEDRFEVLHLRWPTKHAWSMQMVNLMCLPNKIWVATLGTPQAIIASTDLLEWSILSLEGFNKKFCFSMSLAAGKRIVSFATGKSFYYFPTQDLCKYVNGCQRQIYVHRALFENFLSLGHRFQFGRVRVTDVLYRCFTEFGARTNTWTDLHKERSN